MLKKIATMLFMFFALVAIVKAGDFPTTCIIIVRDANGNPVANCDVSCFNPTTSSVKTLTTNGLGIVTDPRDLTDVIYYSAVSGGKKGVVNAIPVGGYYDGSLGAPYIEIWLTELVGVGSGEGGVIED